MDSVYNNHVVGQHIHATVLKLATEAGIYEGSGEVTIHKWALQQLAKELVAMWDEFDHNQKMRTQR